jgi:O-antigen ligase
MSNYILYSNVGKVTHNAYTQVAAELGLAAVIFYIGFIVTPLKSLRKIELSRSNKNRRNTSYYLAIGMQASLIGFIVSSFFASVAYQWYVYYLVAYSICLRRMT